MEEEEAMKAGESQILGSHRWLGWIISTYKRKHDKKGSY